MNGLTWLSWRRQRAAVLTAFALLAVSLLESLDGQVLVEVVLDGINSAMQGERVHRDFSQGEYLELVRFLNNVLPTLIALFWGVPLLGRDAEHGTHRLVLTQDAGRARWFTSQFSLAAAVTLLLSTVLSLLAWSPSQLHPARDDLWDYRNMLFGAPVFDGTGPRVVAAALFGLAAGTAAGLLLRRVLPAMLVSLGVVAGTGTLVNHYREALLERTAAAENDLSVRDSACTDVSGGECVGAGNHEFWKAHPPGDYWVYQWAETALFLGLFAAAVGLTCWLLKRRLV